MKVSKTKVVIIGAGMVGSATAFCMIVQGICSEVVIVDRNTEKATGEAMDLRHSIEYQHRNVRVRSGGYEECCYADIVVITASIPMGNITSRNQLLEKNIGVMNDVVDAVMATGFHGHFIVVSNPVDILSYQVYKRSGLPKSQVIGTGTSLETARLKNILGDIIGIDPRSIHAYVIGEHGETMTVPWSTVRVGGKDIFKIIEDNPDRFEGVDLDELVDQTAKVGFEIFNRKGSTQFGIASATTAIASAILQDEMRMLSVSALLDGEYGESGVYCGVPAIVGRKGILEITQCHLSDHEHHSFAASIQSMKKLIQDFDL